MIEKKTYTQYYEQEEFLSQIEKFNNENLLIEEIIFDDDAQQIHRTINEYDKQNRIIHSIQYDENNELIEDKKNFFIESNKEVYSETLFPDNSITKEYRERSENKLLIKWTDEDDEFEGSEERILNEKGLTIQLIQTNFMNKITAFYEYEYDEKNQMIKAVEKDDRKKFLKAYAFTYDNEGNKTVEEELNKKDKIISRIIHQYENDKIIKTKAAEGDTHFYYNNELLIKEETLYPDGSANVIVYSYNENKDITEEKHYDISQGNEIQEYFLQKQIRYEYNKN